MYIERRSIVQLVRYNIHVDNKKTKMNCSQSLESQMSLNKLTFIPLLNLPINTAMIKYTGATHSFPYSSTAPPLHLPSISNSIQEKQQASPIRPTHIAHSSSSSTETTKCNSTGGANAPGRQALPMLVLNALDDLTNMYIERPPRRAVDPEHVLCDNFAPVDELPPTECEVIEGSLPPCLDGAYIRNGPNPQHVIPQRPYHLFDGDGMLHSIRISRGKVTLCSRYVKTNKYIMERRAGVPIVPSIFCGFNGLAVSITRTALLLARFLAGHYSPANGIGTANTSLALFGNHLYALGESDLPYAVRLTSHGDIETLGRQNFGGKLEKCMTAHPKQDVKTGEVFAFRFSPMRPFLTYFRFDADGDKQPDVPIFSIARPSLLHDFAITSKYAVFTATQIGLNPLKIFGQGSAACFESAKVPKLGLIPRYAVDESEMKWFDMPGFNPLHTINAWDEDDGIVMLAPNVTPIQHSLERMELLQNSLEKVRIDLKTGKATRHPVSTRNLEFAMINPAYLGKKNRFVYAAIGDPMPKMSGVVKLDVSKGQNQDCTVGCRMYGQRCYGGEPFFVAREPDNPDSEEDDGYLLSYVHDEMTGESRFLVMDAKSEELDILAVVKLPRRVPYGFHGLFVRESDLTKL